MDPKKPEQQPDSSADTQTGMHKRLGGEGENIQLFTITEIPGTENKQIGPEDLELTQFETPKGFHLGK